jgi:hypothetical protein
VTTITEALENFGHFHDWYIDIIATRNEAEPKVPDTFILGLFDQERRATITFRGVTRAGIENAGLLRCQHPAGSWSVPSCPIQGRSG